MPTRNRKSGREISCLARYLRDDLFDKFVLDRKASDEKCQRNLDAFNGVLKGDWKVDEGEGWRSKTFIKLTKRKVIAAYSIAIDLMLQDGKIPFEFELDPFEDEQIDDMPYDMRTQVEADIEDAEKLIDQQLGDCNASRQVMQTTLSCGIYGEAYMKWFVQDVERNSYRKVSMAPEGYQDDAGEFSRYEPYTEVVDSPAWQYVSRWNVFRDLESEDIQKGVGYFEREMTSPYKLRQNLGAGSFWIDANILTAIDEAAEPGDKLSQVDVDRLPPVLRNIEHRHNVIEQLEFWGRVPRKVVEEFEADLKESDPGFVDSLYDIENDGDEIEIMAVLADDEIVRYVRNDTGKRPMFRSVWEIKLDHADGTGVADNVEDMQRVMNGMSRAYEDNMKLSANVMLAVNERLLPNWDKKIKPGIIPVSDEVGDDVRKAVQQVIIADVGRSLLEGMNKYERMMDDDSMLPKIMQGEVADKRKPDTAFEMNQLLTNAGKYIGGVIKNQDDGLIEPLLNENFAYNMLSPGVRGKGNFRAKAMGFKSFQDKVVRLQKLMQALNLVLSHEALAGESNLRTSLTELYKSLDLEPDKHLKSVEDKQAEQQQMMEMQAMAEQKALEGMRQQRRIEFDAEQAGKDADLQRDLARKAADVEGKVVLEGVALEADVALDAAKTENELIVQAAGAGLSAIYGGDDGNKVERR